jgi:hypothetical protein
MKSLFLFFAVLAMTTSCELRSTSFDPDEQLVSEDELAQIALWDQYQEENQSTADYERNNAQEFVGAKCDARKSGTGTWIIEGLITNYAKEVHYKDVLLVMYYCDDSKNVIGTEEYTINENLAPGDQTGFYFKSDTFKDASSMDAQIANVKPVK